MSKYTPTTEKVRDSYVSLKEEYENAERPDAEEEFNRWLARRDLAVAAVAWDLAVASMVYEDGGPIEIAYNINPYREKVRTT